MDEVIKSTESILAETITGLPLCFEYHLKIMVLLPVFMIVGIREAL